MPYASNLTSNNWIRIQIYNVQTKYDDLFINKSQATRVTSIEPIVNTTDLSAGDYKLVEHPDREVLCMKINGLLAHYLIKEFWISNCYRGAFIQAIKPQFKRGDLERIVKIQLVSVPKEIIDYDWNRRTTYLIWERLELDHALSWLSTLGGAFSALGDYFSNCALIAGKISFHQLKLAMRLGDENVASRCRLYLSLSLIQRGYLRQAKKIIRSEYAAANSGPVIDIRLVKMCHGIWAKLKYEYWRQKQRCIL